jgi:xylulokinase
MTVPANAAVLAIDLGTSGPKVGLVNCRGEILAWKFEAVPLLIAPGGQAEQSPDAWWSAICNATRGVLDQRLVPVEDIQAVCCTAQWNGTVPVDKDGKALMNAMTWLDSRGAKYVPGMVEGLINLQGYDPIKLMLTWIRLTGGAPSMTGKDPDGHILFIKNERPEVFEHTYQFLEPKDYLNLRLTGKAAASYDSISMHWLTDIRDLGKIRYVQRLFDLLGAEPEKFPPLKQAVDILGPLTPQAAAELGLSPSTRVVMGTPDMHATALGSGAVRDFQPHLYLGTSAWISCYVPFKKTSITGGMVSLPSAIPNRYLVINEQDWAAGCLNYVLDNIIYPPDPLSNGSKPEDAHVRWNQAAGQAPPGSERVIFTPWLYGERTPIDDPWVRGAFFNLSPNKTRSHMARAVFEGVAYNARWLLENMEKFVGRRLDGFNVVGGGAVSDLWCQIFADVFDRMIHQMKEPRMASLRGAANLALVALGCTSFESLAESAQIENTYVPNPSNRRIYDDLFREFVNLYRATRPIYARLNSGR